MDNGISKKEGFQPRFSTIDDQKKMELHTFIANKIIDRLIFGHNIAFLKIIASDENQRLIVILNWIKSRENE